MSNKTLDERWAKAKSEYDVLAKENAKAREAIEKQISKLMSEGEKEHKKLKTKEKFSSFLADPVLTQMHAPQLKAVIAKIKAKQKELTAMSLVKPRKSVGCTPAFKEVEKVLDVGARLKDAGVDSPDKWKAWYKAAISSLKKCATAEKNFEKWIGSPDKSNEAATEFQRAFKNIMGAMSEKGTPLMKHAGTILQAA